MAKVHGASTCRGVKRLLLLGLLLTGCTRQQALRSLMTPVLEVECRDCPTECRTVFTNGEPTTFCHRDTSAAGELRHQQCLEEVWVKIQKMLGQPL